MYKLVLLRHGESQWNLENRFTGWTDVDLTEQGKQEAWRAGKLLQENNLVFDHSFTSLLTRAIRTQWIVLDALKQMYLPLEHDWRLNERHYGALQGLNKAETAKKFGEEQVLIWRRSYQVAPEALSIEDTRHPSFDVRYRDLSKKDLPCTESLHDTVERVVPYWQNHIAPVIQAGKRVIITAHGNSLRALIKHLDQMHDEQIISVNIPTAQPLVYELDAQLKPLRHYYLDNPDNIAKASAAVAQQGAARLV